MLLTLVVLGSGFITLLHLLTPDPHPISLVMPPISGIVHLVLLVYLYRNPQRLMLVLWIGATSILGSIIFIVWYFTLQAAFSTDIKLIETLPPLNSLPLAYIVTMFIFARPSQVLITAIVSWLLIVFPVLIYLIIHSDELFTPRGLEMALTLLPVMATILVLIPVYRGIEEKMASLKSEQTRMEILSVRDPLTQIYNRRGIESLFSDFAVKDKENTGAVMFDIDHFKNINDRYGHGVGDTVLCQIAERCRSILRKDDLFARWGGEEFLVLIRGAGNKALYRIADDLRMAISDEPVKPVERVTASFGVTRFYPTDSMESLLQRADDAMYQAKRQGRDRVVNQWEKGDASFSK